ncbi:hypothetical protein Trydic_g1779 [Trypoxylus dichotomus]
MPLHGYPRNEALLNSLNNKMQNFLEEKYEEYEQPLFLCKKSFNEKELQHSVGLLQMNDDLEALEVILDTKLHTKHVLSELLNTFSQLKKSVVPPQEFDTDVTKILNFYKKNFVIPPEYLLSASPNLLLSYSAMDEDYQPHISCYPQDFEIIRKIEEFVKKKEEFLKKIDSTTDKFKYNINAWQEIWDKALVNVINLYKVKYDPCDN